MVYLKVKNHSMTPSENKIFIGPVNKLNYITKIYIN